MQSTTTENTVQRWESVIADLTAKSNAIETEVTALSQERQNLILDAELGVNGAAKRLAKLNEEINHKTRHVAVKREAIEQAKHRLAEAREAEAAIAEQNRQSELRTLASAVLKHATEFGAGLQHATQAGSALKLVVKNMIERATPVERSSLNQLLEPGPYMRAAERAGLRAYIEFQSYPGLREHLVALEDALSAHIGRWLEPDEEQK